MTRVDGLLVRRAAIAAAAIVCMSTGAPARSQDSGGTTDEARAPDTADAAVVGDLMWLLGSNGENVAWDQAQEYCETLEHAGFDDWRLPTLPELEAIHDPSAATGLRAPLELEDCCAWSSTNLVEEPAAAKGALPDPTNAPRDYYWGFLFGSGDRYYSFRSFPDGLAMCVREP